MAELAHVALGGTISMEIFDGLAVPALASAELLAAAGVDAVPVDLARVGGPEIDFPLLERLARTLRDLEAGDAAGAIVTLGTDAIEEVAGFLTYCGPWRLPIVVTGSMEPGGEPGSDASANLRDAAAVARTVELTEPVVVFAGRVFLARQVIKVSGLAREAFGADTGPEWSVAAALGDGRLAGAPPPCLAIGMPGPGVAEVPIVTSAVSIGGEGWLTVRSLPPAIVFVAAGAGNLTTDVARLATAALAAGTVVAIATRALDRQVSPVYGYPGGSGTLAAAGAVLAERMTAHRLRMFLLLAVSQGRRGPDLRDCLLAHVQSLGHATA